jgi:hypothetical protein
MRELFFQRGGAETRRRLWRQIKRAWCRLMHSDVMFGGGRTYQCRTCLERFENPALDGPAMGPGRNRGRMGVDESGANKAEGRRHRAKQRPAVARPNRQLP